MFSKSGNTKVHHIVLEARVNGTDWTTVYNRLRILAQKKNCGEAMDTVVRERVYDACGFTEDFYV